MSMRVAQYDIFFRESNAPLFNRSCHDVSKKCFPSMFILRLRCEQAGRGFRSIHASTEVSRVLEG